MFSPRHSPWRICRVPEEQAEDCKRRDGALPDAGLSPEPSPCGEASESCGTRWWGWRTNQKGSFEAVVRVACPASRSSDYAEEATERASVAASAHLVSAGALCVGENLAGVSRVRASFVAGVGEGIWECPLAATARNAIDVLFTNLATSYQAIVSTACDAALSVVDDEVSVTLVVSVDPGGLRFAETRGREGGRAAVSRGTVVTSGHADGESSFYHFPIPLPATAKTTTTTCWPG